MSWVTSKIFLRQSLKYYLCNTEQHLSSDPLKGYSRHDVEKQCHFLPLGNPQQSPKKIAPGHSNLEEDRNTRKSWFYTICSLRIQLKY